MIDVGGAKSYIYGDDDLNTPADETFRTNVASYKVHPRYTGPNSWQTGYDVAVITTADDLPVPENQWEKVAGSKDNGFTQAGKSGTVFGYGRTAANGGSGVLYKTTLPVNDANNCQVFNVRVNPDVMVCTGYNDGSHRHLAVATAAVRTLWTEWLPGSSRGAPAAVTGTASWRG
ncbi:trypsin-like serine protease [Amycolatopsis suaedae]|uniref:trypsin-like serine protease n=1 Tax=Amycolatopsis suaedae TaxID=2510978 RepID=UPI0023EA4D6D|nr:trypsin-like serine protease [Amycolatopsis suaedae]